MDEVKIVKTKSKKKMVLLALVLLCFVIGASYAIWNYGFTGEDNAITAADVSIDFLEDNDVIGLTNALPISDDDGKNGEVFDFAVTTDTVRNMGIKYTLSIEKLPLDEGYTALNDNDIKVYLTDENDNVLVEPTLISDLDNYQLYSNINMHSSINETIKDKYKLRVWIDKDVSTNEWDENTHNQYNFKLNIASEEKDITYQVRYNGNGGVAPSTLLITDETNHWTENNEIYKSGNYHVASSTSSIRSKSFILTEAGTLSFDWAVSSEGASYDYLYYTLYKDGSTTALTGTGTNTKIGGNSSITDEANLTYTTVTKELEPGSYILEFSYKKDSSTNSGLDRGYVKNIIIPESSETMDNSSLSAKNINNLTVNSYKKAHYNFVGWSTTENGIVEYTNEQVLSEPLTNVDGDVVDLYAVWEPEKYNVDVVVQNGTVTGDILNKLLIKKMVLL